MKNLIGILFVVVLASCSHEVSRETITISTVNTGIIKNAALSIPLFFTSNITEKNIPANALKIHQGHFLSYKNKKETNEEILKSLVTNNFQVVNLSLEDIAIAEVQNINFEDFPSITFLNSSVTDVTYDNLFSKSNVRSFYIYENVVFIGLSDKKNEGNINANRYLINDYVYSILKVKKATRESNVKSYILLHNLGNEINEIMSRLPPTFINSLAD